MRILHTLDYWARGYGRGDAVYLLAEAQARAGHETRVVIADCFGSRKKEALRHLPEGALQLRQAHRQLDPTWERWLLEVADQFQPDIVHTHELSDSWSLAGAVPCPVLLSIRVDYRHLPAAPLLLEAASRCDWVEYWNPDIVGWLLQAGIKNISWNCAPVVLQQTLARSPEPGLLVSQGRLDSLKNQAALVESMPEVLSSVPNARLWLIGEGPALDSLENLVDRLHLQNKVTLCGWKNNVAPYLQRAELALYPGKSMGFDRAIMEAMLCGVPVITSPALSPVVGYGKYGTVAEDWGPAITRALQGGNINSESAKAHARENYSLEAVLGRTESLYEKLLGDQTRTL